MEPSESFATLMARLRAGDEAAATVVFNHFACQILDLARTQLHDRIRRKIDPEDVLQSVFRSFFLRQRQGQFAIENWDNLWGILMVMTVRKCGRQVQYFQTNAATGDEKSAWTRTRQWPTSRGCSPASQRLRTPSSSSNCSAASCKA